VDEAPTDLPSRRETRPYTLGPQQLKMRYVKVLPKLGSGQFGEVYKAIDVDSGKFMAVKILERPTRASKQEDWRQLLYYALKREVETLSEISHVSKSSSTSYTHKTNIYASYTSSIILRYKAGTIYR
jgi:serine/threonine protein kinase